MALRITITAPQSRSDEESFGEVSLLMIHGIRLVLPPWNSMGSSTHTAAFVESNRTQMLFQRDLRSGPGSGNLKLLQSGMFGPDTKVSVDIYERIQTNESGLLREGLQRELILDRWVKNGMREDDIGYISDVDEVMTRDFLRAVQMCDVPEFRPGQNCRDPKLVASTLVYEASPTCIQKGRRWYHPDLMISECIDKIGDLVNHKEVQRHFNHGAFLRAPGWRENRTMYPLFNADDYRMLIRAGPKIFGTNGLPTGHHFHNFFTSIQAFRVKYRTYGHPLEEALDKPLGQLLSKDMRFMVDCLMNRSEEHNAFKREKGGWASLEDIVAPIAFKVGHYAAARHKEMQISLAEDEKHVPPNRTAERLLRMKT